MCSEQIFGSDVDFISWDYGMTDGNYPARLFHYFYRAGLTPGRPAILGVRVNGRSRASREARIAELEELGMAAFAGFDASYAHRQDGIPESSGTEAEIAQLPEYVRNFKCAGLYLENGDPYCSAEKYSNYICTTRGKKAGWHPGM
jgi:hypothetical protein